MGIYNRVLSRSFRDNAQASDLASEQLVHLISEAFIGEVQKHEVLLSVATTLAPVERPNLTAAAI